MWNFYIFVFFLFFVGFVESVKENEEDNQNIPLIPSQSEGEIVELEGNIFERSNEEENEEGKEENIKEKIIREYPGIEGFLEDPKKLKILIKKNGETQNKIPEIKNPFASINLKAVGMKHAEFTANLNDYCEEMYKSTNKKDIKNSNEIETEKFEKKKSKKIEKEAREFLNKLKDKWIKESKKNFKLKNKKKVITTKFGKNLKINKKLNLKQLTRNVSKGIENIMRKFSKRSKTNEYKLLKNEI